VVAHTSQISAIGIALLKRGNSKLEIDATCAWAKDMVVVSAKARGDVSTVSLWAIIKASALRSLDPVVLKGGTIYTAPISAKVMGREKMHTWELRVI
jgi:hypothetical protein